LVNIYIFTIFSGQTLKNDGGAIETNDTADRDMLYQASRGVADIPHGCRRFSSVVVEQLVVDTKGSVAGSRYSFRYND
jgi:hypothetical protein